MFYSYNKKRIKYVNNLHLIFTINLSFSNLSHYHNVLNFIIIVLQFYSVFISILNCIQLIEVVNKFVLFLTSQITTKTRI